MSLWSRTIKIMQSQLQKKLRDYIQGEHTNSCWPSLGRLLLLKLLSHIFSISDYRHAVVGASSLYLCQALTQCPVTCTSDIASGLLTVSVLLGYSVGSGKFIPECHIFITSILSLYSVSNEQNNKVTNDTTKSANSLAPIQRTVIASRFKWLRASISQSFHEDNVDTTSGVDILFIDKKMKWEYFQDRHQYDIANDIGVKKINALNISVSVLNTTHHLLSHLSQQLKTSVTYPEIFDPIISVMNNIYPHHLPSFQREYLTSHVILQEQLTLQANNIRSSRKPINFISTGKISIEVKNPRYQVDYTMKKDVDPDEDRVKLKQLNRQVKREQKAAMRELRRDSEFLDQERHKERTEAKDLLRAERNKNFSWMEDQQATINQQVRMAKGKRNALSGGGSGIAKKARVKR